jgi:CubicO group peptidase (beta-lactamase class C family)
MRRILLLPLALAMSLVVPSASAVAKGPLDQATADKIRAFASSAFDELGIPGAAVVVVDADGVVYEQGFGTTDDAGTPVTPTTPFPLASLSKQLTAIAVMQLIESGDLALDATVHSYLPWFGAGGSDTAEITIKDLLAHTSGFSEGAGLVNRSDERPDDDALERNIRRLAETPLSHPIGQFEYSNANYDALGYVVAVASETSYENYMAERVFAPLGMVDTFTSDADARADGLAQGHYPYFGFPIKFPVGFVRNSVPSAYIASSAEDLGRVLMAHLNDGAVGDAHVLSAKGMQGLRQPLTQLDPWAGYGWGWNSYPLWDAGHLVEAPTGSTFEAPIMLEHSGSHSTYATGMVLLPEAGYGVVVLMNRNDEAAPSRFYQIHTGIAAILLRRDAPALVNYDDPLGLYGRHLLGIGVLLMAVGVWWALRRLRHWRREPGSRPHGRWGLVRHLVLPLALDLGLTVLAWWLVLDRADLGVGEYPAILHQAPDIGLAIGLIAVLGLGWGLVRTGLTLAVVRRRVA